MGLVTSVMVRLLGAQPFEMPGLDALAERMKAVSILKKDRLHRYYKSSVLPIPCLAYSDALIFNANYLRMLSADGVLAVGAHEFNHLAKKHILKRLPRTVLPSAMLATVVGYIVSNSNSLLLSASATVLSFFAFLLGSYYVNAKYFRGQETESDFSAVEYVNVAAMISALAILHPQKTGWLTKLLPRIHPTIEQRIHDIQTATGTRNMFSVTVTYGDGTISGS
jgi:hypothetical protein